MPSFIRGRLGNDPVDLGNLKIGSRVEIAKDKVEDWAYMKNGSPVGLFTVRVLMEIRKENEKRTPL